MSSLDISSLPLEGLKRITRVKRGDVRGFLARVFCADELRKAGFNKPIAQVNHTATALRGTVRGLHLQLAPHAEMKLVSCIRGTVFDVAVDLRAGSFTRLSWHGEILSAENGAALLIPEGFAHGFQTLSDDAEMLYCHSAAFHPASEAGFDALDPRLGITWPLAIAQRSPRDEQHAPIPPDFPGLLP